MGNSKTLFVLIVKKSAINCAGSFWHSILINFCSSYQNIISHIFTKLSHLPTKYIGVEIRNSLFILCRHLKMNDWIWFGHTLFLPAFFGKYKRYVVRTIALCYARYILRMKYIIFTFDGSGTPIA